MMSIVGAWGQTDKTIDVKNVWSDYYYSENGLTKGNVYNIKINNRSFAKNSWQFLSLPFEATKSILDDAFGEGNYELQEFDQLDGVTFKFKKMATPSMTTAKPYVIKMLNNAVENPVFKNVTLTANSQADEVQLGNASTVIIRSALWTYAGNTIINQNDSKPYYPLFEGNLVEAGWYGDDIRNMISVSGAYARSMDGTSVPVLSLEGAGGGGNDDPSTMTLQQKIEARMQLTDAPTIYIDLPEIGSQTLDNYLYKNRNTGEAPYRPATIKVVATDDTTSPHYLESFEETNPRDLEIKVRGNSTANPSNGKKAYRLKFAKKGNSSDGKAHKHDLLNRGYTKRNWVLLANNFDHSMIRNALTYHLSELAGGMDFMPGYKFVDLVINNEYRGTYQVSDHCEADKDRINVNEDTGWYVEFQGRGDMLDKPMCYSQDGLQMNINNPEPAYTETESTRADSTLVETPLINTVKDWFLNTWIQGFRSADCNSANGGWRALNDEESLLKFWLITELTGDYDGLMAVKAYREENGKLFWGPVWDKDLAYGNYNIDDTKLIHENGNASSLVTFFGTFLFNDINLVKRLRDKLQLMVDDGLKTKLNAKIDELAALVSNTQSLSSTVFPLDTKKGDEKVYGSADASYYSEQLKTWLSTRIDNVLQAYKNQYNALNQSQLESNVTYDPDALWTYNGFSWNGWDRSGNMNKIVNVDETNRTYKAGVWNTFCVPYDLTEAQMATIFGDSYELKVHSAMHSDGETMIFTEPDNKNIVAGYPYLLKFTGSDVINPTFNLVQITETSNSTSGYNGHYVTYDDKHYFYGTLFTASNLNTSTDCLFANDEVLDNSILYKTSLATIAGARAFVRIPADEETIKISFTEESITPVVRTQLTYLPTIYIDTKDGAAIQSSAGEWVAAGIQVIDANENLKPFTQEIGLTSAGKNILQIRGRGTTSWTNTDKKSYRLQFGKDDKDDLGNVTKSYKHNLLVNEDGAGVVKKRNWVLLANSGDKTLVRNALTKEIGDAVGLPFTPGYRFVDLVLNGTYVGTYQVTEFLEADANRVNIDEDNGLLIQMTGLTDADLTNDHVISGEDYTKPYLTIKNPEVKAKNQATWNEAFNSAVYDFNGMWEANDGTGLNKESLVDWYIASEIIGDYEALSSIYAYKDVNATELSFGPLWGTETAYDNNASITMTSTGLMSDLNDNSTHTGLMTKAGKQSAWQTKIEGLWAQPWFANAVRLRWNTLYNNGALTTTLKDKVTTLAGIVNATDETFTISSQAKNYTATTDGGAGWTIAGQGITNYSKSVASEATFASEVERLQGYFDTRLPYLDKKFKALDKTIEYDVTRSDAISAYSIYNGQTTNVTLKNRGTIWGGEWNSICLPFSLTDEQLTAVFGEGYELKSFKSVTEGETYNTFNFNDAVNELSAGVPYIIKPTANVTNLTFNNVTLNLSLDNSVVEKTSDKSNTFKFTGTLQPYKMADDGTDWFIGRNNKAYKSNGTLHACRAYFT
ncbi:MAG: CotH kinase family protein, partial [Prevotella sp.]|nr:CotH kinase family protein [Prevotella sp.]